MKKLQLIALVALTFSLAGQAMAATGDGGLGRHTSVESIPEASFMCEITGKMVKRQIAAADIRNNADADFSERGNTNGKVRSGQ